MDEVTSGEKSRGNPIQVGPRQFFARVTLVLLSLFLMIGLTPGPASAAGTVTVRGTVVCNSGRPVVGVWVNSSGGGSGLSKFTPMPGKSNVAWYTRTLSFSTAATALELRVGCGGSASSWTSKSIAASRTVATNFIHNTWCNDPTSGTAYGNCYTGTLPNGRSYNWFDGGQCTWGAAEIWNRATGKYPSWSGDARNWAINARAQGFLISTVPHARSLIVVPPYVGTSSSLGHVAWVTDVWVSSGTLWMRIREMNRTGLWQWSTRDVPYDSRYRWIVAPPGQPVTS